MPRTEAYCTLPAIRGRLLYHAPATPTVAVLYHAPYGDGERHACPQWRCHACLQILCWPAGNIRRTQTTEALNKSDLVIFPLLFLGANYAYVRALALASPAFVQCVFGAAPAVVCGLSRLWLREPFTRRRGLAAGAALAGVALIAVPRGGGTAGAIVALGAVFCAATYKVRWKSRFRAPSPDFVLRAVGLVGGAVAVCSLPIAVTLAATGVETPPQRWTVRDVLIVLGGGVIDVLYNCSIALGLSVASPVFVATGTILAIPGNAVVDAILDHERLGPLQLLPVTRGAEDLWVHPWRRVEQRLAHDTRQDDGEGLAVDGPRVGHRSQGVALQVRALLLDLRRVRVKVGVRVIASTRAVRHPAPGAATRHREEGDRAA